MLLLCCLVILSGNGQQNKKPDMWPGRVLRICIRTLRNCRGSTHASRSSSSSKGRRRRRSSSRSRGRISRCQLPAMREATHASPLQKLRSRKATVRAAIIMHRPERERAGEDGRRGSTPQGHTLSITCNEHNFSLAHSNIYGNFAWRTKLKLNKSSFA